ncbi:UNVERIFIED_CONTAM: hypothetical protein FKN15_025379 [Acipenser sinensis]
MDVATLSALLEEMDYKREAEDKKREERYTALIEKVGIRDDPHVPAGPMMTPCNRGDLDWPSDTCKMLQEEGSSPVGSACQSWQ